MRAAALALALALVVAASGDYDPFFYGLRDGSLYDERGRYRGGRYDEYEKRTLLFPLHSGLHDFLSHHYDFYRNYRYPYQYDPYYYRYLAGGRKSDAFGEYLLDWRGNRRYVHCFNPR